MIVIIENVFVLHVIDVCIHQIHNITIFKLHYMCRVNDSLTLYYWNQFTLITTV